MAIYSIKDLEKLTGIKAHTIRIWEQRYNIIHPQRTDTNIRFYTDDDLRMLMNIALLNKNGYKISKIAKMPIAKIQEKVASISDVNFQFATQLDALTLSVVEMDEYKFDRIIQAHIEQVGFEKTMLDVIYPFLDKLNLLWFTGSIAPVQENFITNLIKRKAIVAIDKLPISPSNFHKKFLLFLPEGERQELTMLMMDFFIRSRGHGSIYLGNDVALADLADAYRIGKPDFIFSIITETNTGAELQPFVDTLLTNFPDSHLILTGYQVIAQELKAVPNLTLLKGMEETISFLDSLKAESDSSPAPSSAR